MSALADLARRLPPESDVDEVVAALEARGITDELAAQRYGHPTVFALGEAVHTTLRAQGRAPSYRFSPSKGPLLTPLLPVRLAAVIGALVWSPVALALFVVGSSVRSLLPRLFEAGCVALVWYAAPGPPAPGLLPLLLAVPLGETLVGWHRIRASAALDGYDDPRAFRAEVRGLAAVTVGALLPPLVTGVALAAAAYRLPYRISAHPDARALVLGLAAGVLLGGLLAVTGLLVAHGRVGTAAVVAAAPLAGAGSLVALWGAAMPGWDGVLLPGTVAALALAYLLGLVAVAHAVFDPDGYR